MAIPASLDGALVQGLFFRQAVEGYWPVVVLVVEVVVGAKPAA